MIRPLRRLHLVMIALLTVALAVLFITGLIAREPIPPNPPIPDTLLRTQIGGQR